MHYFYQINKKGFQQPFLSSPHSEYSTCDEESEVRPSRESNPQPRAHGAVIVATTQTRPIILNVFETKSMFLIMFDVNNLDTHCAVCIEIV